MPQITVLPYNRILEAQPGQTLHSLLAAQGLLDAPCGGQGTCGKCRVLADGTEALACQTLADRDMTITLPAPPELPEGAAQAGNAVALDIGTTTVVGCLLDGSGAVLAKRSVPNPQRAFGADVVSRLRAAEAGQAQTMTRLIRNAVTDLLLQLCSTPEVVDTISLVGNPAMQQLFLGLPTENLTRIPFKPILCKPAISHAREIFPCCPKARLLTVPDISAFVGADTVAGVLACGLHTKEAWTLLVDIGTNGEMVLGNRDRMIACSTAAGPALEGANIQWGMGAAPGAIDHVWLESGQIRCSVIGGGEARGICGSGLLDAVAAALDLGLLNRRGKLLGNEKIMLTDQVYLTQRDIRQVQLAKGAIRAGIECMMQALELDFADIRQVVLAGAFGSYLNPDSACRMGLLPEELQDRVISAGNTAGSGAVLLTADPALLTVAGQIAQKAQYLELASLPAFPKAFAKAMELPENWISSAKKAGFTEAALLDPAVLQARDDVRAICAQDKCHAYGKNWTCPPHCGSIQECERKMHRYRRGILLQTVGQLSKDIDSWAYRETERQHLESFARFCSVIRRAYPDALCLGAGGCRICKTCAYPEPCQFPDKAVSSMEGYGLFVTQVCRDGGLAYHHGPRTITYTACVLYDERKSHAQNLK